MIIANPIYDVVFKRLMEDERIAKFFIGTLLDQTIQSVVVKPQEFTYIDKLAGLAVFRLDFIATIKTETGEYQKILVEIQKAKNEVDLMRFRNYLAEQYKKEDLIEDEKVALPITTIYILGFNLPEIEAACIRVERNYKDLVNNCIINKKSDFVEKLTHDSFIVQALRISNKYQTKLDKLLSIFEQAHFVDDNKIVKEFLHETDVDEIKVMADILHYTGTNPTEKKKIEDEQEAWRTVYALTGKVRKQLEDSKKIIDEKEKIISEMAKELEALKQKLNNKDEDQ